MKCTVVPNLQEQVARDSASSALQWVSRIGDKPGGATSKIPLMIEARRPHDPKFRDSQIFRFHWHAACVTFFLPNISGQLRQGQRRATCSVSMR